MMGKIRVMTRWEVRAVQDAKVLAALFVLPEIESTTQRLADEASSGEWYISEPQTRASLKRLETIGLVEKGKRVYDGPAKRKQYQTWKPSYFTDSFYREVT